MAQARRLLAKQGRFNLTPNFPRYQQKHGGTRSSIEVFFKRVKGESLFQVCQYVYEKIDNEVQHSHVPNDLRIDYGLAADMATKRFIWSLFLGSTEGASISEGRFPEVSIAMARSLVETEEGTMLARIKMSFRFHTAANEPVEIRMESNHVIHGNSLLVVRRLSNFFE